jgi:hypothetical protein
MAALQLTERQVTQAKAAAAATAAVAVAAKAGGFLALLSQD